MIQINSERLFIRSIQLSDAKLLAAFEEKNKDFFAPFLPSSLDVMGKEIYWKTKLPELLLEQEREESIRFLLFKKENPEGPLIGICNFFQIYRGAFHACTLGYRIDEDYQQQGLMREALQKTIEYMFTELNLHRIMANYIPSNQRSAKLLSGLGFEKEGLAKQYLHINGMWQDHILTALINPNWQEPI